MQKRAEEARIEQNNNDVQSSLASPISTCATTDDGRETWDTELTVSCDEGAAGGVAEGSTEEDAKTPTPTPALQTAEVTPKASALQTAEAKAEKLTAETVTAETFTTGALTTRNQQNRLRNIRDGYWDLYSPEISALLAKSSLGPSAGPTGLIFEREESYLDHREQTHWRFSAKILIGDTGFRTTSMTIPKYPSSEVVKVLTQVEKEAEGEGRLTFDAEFRFLGVSCVKVRVPRDVVERMVGVQDGERETEEMIEFTGVQVREKDG